MQVEKLSTEDGSDSLYVPELNETYHSIHGAIQESRHVFIEQGLKYFIDQHKPKDVRVLEFGFGTGLNALLTKQFCKNLVSVVYTSLEKFPVSLELSESLNYGDLLKDRDTYTALHKAKWQKQIEITPGFRIEKKQLDFREFIPVTKYDIIYYDAFAPGKQPELWDKNIFNNCYKALDQHGVLVTYSAKGQVRRDLLQVGFKVEKLPGPPGKFEMIRAIKL